MLKILNFVLEKSVALLLIIVTVVVAVYVTFCLFPLKHSEHIKKYSDKFGVDRFITAALIKAESNFNAEAVSSAKAYGLMQLTEDTFDYCMVKLKSENNENDIFDIEKNIMAGTWYLAKMLDRYEHDLPCAIAAYNAGASNVDKWLKNKDYSRDGKNLHHVPFGETQRHIKKIEIYSKIYRILYPELNE